MPDQTRRGSSLDRASPRAVDDRIGNAAVVAQARQGEVAQFDQRELVALIPSMRAFARSLCRDRAQAEDLSQDALASAWRHRDSFTPGTNLKAWVFTILRNRFYSGQRRAWRTTELDPEVAENTLIAVSFPTGSLELDEVRRAMLGLPAEQREALVLIAVSGSTYEEVAGICGCAVGTVKSRVSRARQSLLAALDEGDMAAEWQTPGHAMAAILAEGERCLAHRHRGVIERASRRIH